MTTFNAGTIEATMDLDVDPFQRGVQYVREEGRRLGRERYTVQLDADTGRAVTQLETLRTLLGDVTGRHVIRVDLQGYGAVNAEVIRMTRMLERLERTYSPHVDLDGGAATIAQVELLQQRLDRLERDRTDVHVGADTAEFTSNVSSASSRLGGLIALGAFIAPALIPGLVGAAAAAGGLASALGIAGAGLGALAGGVIGNITQVVGAQKTLEQSTQQVATAQAAVDAANQGAAASARQVQSAEQGLADARRNAARSVAAAEGQLAAAQRGVKYAQDALNKAREEAADRLADYSDKLKGAALDEDAAELAVRRARQTLAEVLADPNASKLDRDEARQSLAEAQFQLGQVRQSRDELQAEAKQARKDGIAGDAQVKQARQNLADANRQVAAAEQGVTDAKRDGARAIKAAQQQLADANRNAAASSQAAADAAEALRAAQADQARAQATLATPAAQAFLAAIDAVKDSWGEFLDLTRDASLGVTTQALELFADILPKFAPLANAAAEGVGRLLDRFDAWVQGGGLDGALDFLTKHAPDMIESLGIIFGNLGRWLGNIIVAFQPFADQMLDGLEKLTDGWADWAGQLGEDQAFQDFIDYALEYGPLFLDTLGSMWDALVQIGRAIAPAAGPILVLLRSAFDAIAGMDPTTLALVIGVAGAIAGLTVAPVAGTAVAVVALVAAIASLIDGSEDMQRALEPWLDLFSDIGDDVMDLADIAMEGLRDAWENVQPALEDLGAVVQDELLPAFRDFWDMVQPILRGLAHGVGPAAEVLMRRMIGTVKGLVKILSGVLNFLTGTFTGDWDKAWKGIQQIFTGVWDVVSATPRAIYDTFKDELDRFGGWLGRTWGDIWQGVKDTVGDARDWIAGKLWRGEDSLLTKAENAFADAVDGIGTVWDGLKKAAGTPVKFVVDTIYNNGIRKVVNAIPGVDDIGEVDTSDWPSFAKGGVLPGYSPGRDIHRFVSPTAGVLNLGGGEGILTTRTTSALGGEAGIAALNAAGEQGRLNPRMLLEQSHADGGIVYVDGEKMSKVAAAQLAVAERSSGIPMYVMQGSYQPATSYSGTSHTGGGVMDTGPGSFAAQAALRRVAFAAWARNIPGAAYAGSGAHVHSVSRIDPTARGHAQLSSFARGEDGLGHADYGPNPAVSPGLVRSALALAGNPDLSGFAGFSGTGSAQASGGGNPFTRFLGAVDAVKDFAAGIPGYLKKLATMDGWGGMIRDAMKEVLGDFRGWVNDKIPGPGPFPGGIFDTGGTLYPGHVAVNMGDTPEKVLTDAQWRALAGVALTGRGGLSSDDVDRIVEAIEQNRAVQVTGTSDTTAAEVVDRINFELRR